MTKTYAPCNLFSPPLANTENTVAVLWDKVEENGVLNYHLYVNEKLCGKATETDFTITGLEPNAEYSVFVRCEYGNGELSEKSDTITVKTSPIAEVFNVMDFGAVSDGTTLNTAAIQKTIDKCTNGGVVYVPDGVFRTGALHLKSNMTLCVDGALIGSEDIADYPIMTYRFEGLEGPCYSSLINTVEGEIENLKIIGNGKIDASGSVLRQKETTEKAGKPGRAVCIRNAKNVYMKDITVRQSPAWCVHFIYCEGVSINNVKVHTKFDENGNRYKDICNGDGIDVDSSKNFYIFNSMIASQDDCIAIKSGKDEEGRAVGISTENIRVTNCTFKSGFGVVVGSEMSGDVRNVLVQDCKFDNAYSIASIKAPRGRGGVIEDIRYENNTLVKEEDELHDCEWFRGAIYIDQFYSHIKFDADAKEPVNEGTSIIRNISIENAQLDTKSGNAIYLTGLPEMPLENIALKNIRAVGKYGFKANNINGLKLENVSVKSMEDEDCEFKNVVQI